MYANLMGIGWRPTLVGAVVLLLSAVAGWGMAGDRSLILIRGVRYWMEWVMLPAVRHGRWAVRTSVIFINNASICALLILLGCLPGGAWIGIVSVGLAMGIAIRILGTRTKSPDGGPEAEPRRVDGLTQLGLWLNMLEVPAILATLGMTMGQLASPNGLDTPILWRIYLICVIPTLFVAACGEALWIGRQRPTILL